MSHSIKVKSSAEAPFLMGWCGPEAPPEITTLGEISMMSRVGQASITGDGKTFSLISKRYD